uniref:AAA+ ATPase domain-containing protein n=1 Tax=Salix viminalis TaxID=40686 RepID=A0A6N2KGY0_SALVM
MKPTDMITQVGSVIASVMFAWAMFKQYCPHGLQEFMDKYSKRAFTFFYPYIQITFNEFTGDRFMRSEAYSAIENYLGSRSSTQAKRLKADVVRAAVEDDYEEVDDEFQGVKLKWAAGKHISKTQSVSFYPVTDEKKYYRLTFHRRHRQLCLGDYLNHVLKEGNEIKVRNRQRKLYTNSGSYWRHVVFQHPASFESLAMEAERKQEIMDDLLVFSTAEEFYARIGRAWKRGYLLSARRDGKSTMIAAMAILNYDIYDLELTAVKDNTELRKLLIDTTSRSIIVIEDIDCSLDLTGQRKKKKEEGEGDEKDPKLKLPKEEAETKQSQVTLSGILNFVDGLWSACKGERLIVFTTNFVEKLDPALIRKGRMDKHIELSYCSFEAFQILAKNYLKLESHHLFARIQELLGETKMTPAEVAEHLMPKTISGDAMVCLESLIGGLEKAKEDAILKAEEEVKESARLKAEEEAKEKEKEKEKEKAKAEEEEKAKEKDSSKAEENAKNQVKENGVMFAWAMFKQYCPYKLQEYIDKYSKRAFTFIYPYIQISFNEFTGDRFMRSEAYSAIENYLGSRSSTQAKRLKADVVKSSQSIILSMDDYEEKYYRLTFHRRHRQLILGDYLNHVLKEGNEIKVRNRQRKLYTNSGSYWRHVVFQHPASFESLAMEAERKQEIMDDLLVFSTAEEFYARIGRAWKRGYLLFGPPGTGKSTMIAAMANLLNYDIYDLELTAVKDNTELRKLLIDTTSRSIIVIEDIDCSLDLTGQRKKKKEEGEGDEKDPKPKLPKEEAETKQSQKLDPALIRKGRMDKHIELILTARLISPVRGRRRRRRGGDEKDPKLKLPKEEAETKQSQVTLSGILNFVDGLWSACKGERLIVFTTNFVEKLDPALIRKGRMDKHIELSYCSFEAFQILAKNYLKLESHHLFARIQELLGETKMTPAEVAEHLMPKTISGDATVCLESLIGGLEKAKEDAILKAEEEVKESARLKAEEEAKEKEKEKEKAKAEDEEKAKEKDSSKAEENAKNQVKENGFCDNGNAELISKEKK